MNYIWKAVILISLTLSKTVLSEEIINNSLETCDNNVFLIVKNKQLNYCPLEAIELKKRVYILYDVNTVEGFNLRRDVYIRLAVFVRHLQYKKFFNNVRLVLPPWSRLYHWKSNSIQQDNLPWKTFFDIESLQRYAPVLDFPQFQSEAIMFALPNATKLHVQKVLQLQQFPDMFENGVFHEKYEILNNSQSCRLQTTLLHHSLLLTDNKLCVRYQGNVNLLEHLLRSFLRKRNDLETPYIFVLLNAEIVLHDHWGDREFWRARRSMRFAAKLVNIANDFRLREFNSSDDWDRVQRPALWELETAQRRGMAIGGDYLCAHLRRGDFVRGRAQTTPTLRSAAAQMKHALQHQNLSTIFLATDADAFEVKNLRSHLTRVRVVRFNAASLEQRAQIMDGGRAIIDQLICAHARYFIGTYESTFTYRIYEEREILGFPQETTFNTFCKNESYEDCPKNSVWPIIY